ncbi:uncharacterized protein LOC144100713 [Amblyomma americanum]
MSVRIANPFDSDRARHDAASAASDSATPAVARLLAQMQTEPVVAASAAVNGTEDPDDLQDFLYEGSTELVSLCCQGEFDELLPPPRQSTPQSPGPAAHPTTGFDVPDASTATPTRVNRRRTALEDELQAHLEAVAEEKTTSEKNTSSACA